MTYKGWYAIKPNNPNQTKPNQLENLTLVRKYAELNFLLYLAWTILKDFVS